MACRIESSEAIPGEDDSALDGTFLQLVGAAELRVATLRDSAGYGLWIDGPAEIQADATRFLDNLRGDRYPDVP